MSTKYVIRKPCDDKIYDFFYDPVVMVAMSTFVVSMKGSVLSGLLFL